MLFLKDYERSEAFNLARTTEKLNYILNYKTPNRYDLNNNVNKLFFEKQKKKIEFSRKPLNSFNEDVKTIREDISSDSSPVEKYNFKAEVNKVMDIIVNSLYTDKDVFFERINFECI